MALKLNKKDKGKTKDNYNVVAKSDIFNSKKPEIGEDSNSKWYHNFQELITMAKLWT